YRQSGSRRARRARNRRAPEGDDDQRRQHCGQPRPRRRIAPSRPVKHRPFLLIRGDGVAFSISNAISPNGSDPWPNEDGPSPARWNNRLFAFRMGAGEVMTKLKFLIIPAALMLA